MRRLLIIAAALFTISSASGTASAQTKPMIYLPPVTLQKIQQPRLPIINFIPPSVALSRAMTIAPQATALGVKLKGPLYIVKLKQGNQVLQVHVDAATGALLP
ncbi:MAG: hypothetical protein HY245_13225 [Rhizobiales bacterium]|nr:hypothetical protein [Hyphomicrobiales bacterium]MBI3674352.1 hypothetical protein [Hyphomicrobiales bacterium]